MREKVMNVGILPIGEYQKRLLAIARGEYVAGKSEPKIWFESLRSMAQLLSPENQALLRLIDEKHPQSLTELADLSQRKKSNLSRTLRTLEQCGIIEFSRHKRKLIPRVKATRFCVEFGIHPDLDESWAA